MIKFTAARASPAGVQCDCIAFARQRSARQSRPAGVAQACFAWGRRCNREAGPTPSGLAPVFTQPASMVAGDAELGCDGIGGHELGRPR
jgi:hypothetical protein